jgi:hypothetical protein
MKRIKITNVSGVKLEFFIRFEDSDDKLVSLEPGASCFSFGTTFTKSMRIFDRKGLLKIDKGEYPITEDFSNAFITEVSEVNPSIIPNATPDNDEVLDNLHTTKSIQIESTGSLEGDLLKFHNIGNEEFEQIKKDIVKQITEEEPHVSVNWAMENILGIKPSDITPEFEGAHPTMEDAAPTDIFSSEHTTKNSLLEEAEKQAKDYKEEDEKKQYKYNYKKKPGRKKKRGPKAGAKKKKLKEEKKKKDNNEQE